VLFHYFDHFLADLVRKQLLSPEWTERLLSWRHTGFNVHSHIFIARVTSHIPDKDQVTVRYYGLYANAHRGKVRKASVSPFVLRMAEGELKPIPSKGWAAMIQKVCEVDPLLCPKCGGVMKVVAFITDFAVVDKIIDHLKLSFIAERPPPSHIAYQELLMAAEASAEYSS
jgi:Putative transposase